MQAVAKTVNPFLGTTFFLVTSGTTKSSIKTIFIQRCLRPSVFMTVVYLLLPQSKGLAPAAKPS